MNLTLLDWSIVLAFTIFVFVSVLQSRRHMRSVADFLSANRTGGRYLLSVSQGMCAIGSITIVANWQQNYAAGFAFRWWEFAMAIVLILIAVSGWITYRFRQTRCLTMAQFFEIRYSRRFRIFAGLIAWVAGVVNFGIFPSVGALFFIHFCGIPEHFQWLGLGWSSYPLIMAAFLSLTLFFVFAGGQIAVMITDFLQAIFVSIVFVVMTVYLLCCTGVIDWGHIATVLSSAAENQSPINPFKTGDVEVFNIWFFAINVVIVFYNKLSWQGTQGFNSSAKSAHEAKMGEILSTWRWLPHNLMFAVVPIVAYTVMNYHGNATAITDIQTAVQGQVDTLSKAQTAAIGNQMITPLVLVKLLPPGLMGALTAAMLAATIGTHASYMHSWGSIFIQDVVMPFRDKPFAPKTHLLWLRGSILGVTLFIFIFSLFFINADFIWPFLMITGAIFCGGSGAVIIGGLYWKRGTTAAAWTALISGSSIAVASILITNYWKVIPKLVSHLGDCPGIQDYFANHEKCPINGAWFSLISMAIAAGSYVVISLLSRQSFDMDKLLHRGQYAVAGEEVIAESSIKSTLWTMFGMTREFSRSDKFICVLAYAWTFGWMAVFLGITGWNFLIHKVSDQFWLGFWHAYIWIHVVAAIIVIVWFAIGGFRDLFRMLRQLNTMERDHSDDGFVGKE